MLQPLRLELMPDILAAANKELDRAGADLNSRPYIAKARSVTIKIDLTPDVTENSAGQSRINVAIKSTTDTKLPAQPGAEFIGIARNGEILVNPESPDSPAQSSLFEVLPSAGERAAR